MRKLNNGMNDDIATGSTLISSNASNVTIEESIITTKEGSILLANSESNITIMSTSIINSTSQATFASAISDSALIQISSGKLNTTNCSVNQIMEKW